MNTLNSYAKAITGAIVAALSAYQMALVNDAHVDQGEWAGIAVAFIVALTLIWAVPNKPETP